jgi:hypothetical protein
VVVDGDALGTGSYGVEPAVRAAGKYLAAVGVTMNAYYPITYAEYNQDSAVSSAWAGPWGAFIAFPLVVYPFRFGAGSGEYYSTGLIDPVLNKLWLEGLRANPTTLHTLEGQLILQTLSQAYTLTIIDSGIYTYVSKRVKGVRRPSDAALQIVDWSPGQ